MASLCSLRLLKACLRGPSSEETWNWHHLTTVIVVVIVILPFVLHELLRAILFWVTLAWALHAASDPRIVLHIAQVVIGVGPASKLLPIVLAIATSDETLVAQPLFPSIFARSPTATASEDQVEWLCLADLGRLEELGLSILVKLFDVQILHKVAFKALTLLVNRLSCSLNAEKCRCDLFLIQHGGIVV